jgi:prolyl-tRNA synthetase
MVGAVVMAHGDDSGLQLPPRIAPLQLVIVPIFRNDAERSQIETALEPVLRSLEEIRLRADWRPERPGYKFNEWELKGVPLRLEIGPRDLAKGEATLVRRLDRGRESVKLGELEQAVPAMLESIQAGMLARAREFRESRTVRLASLEELVRHLETSIGFVITPWCQDAACEQTVKERTTATTRVILEDEPVKGNCAVCGRPARTAVVWAKAY